MLLMPRNIFIGLVALLLVGVLTFQISSLKALAQMVPLTGPLTPPITSPEETPTMTPTHTPTVTPTPPSGGSPTMTPTVTPTPKHVGKIVGKVTYNQLGRLMHGVHRIIPASNAMVKVVNFFNGEVKFTTTTDEHGKYALDVPAGLYQVFVYDNSHTFFVPPLRVIRVGSYKKHPVHADFRGLKFVGFPFNH